MPVTNLINDMMYQLEKRREVHDELSKDPLTNPDWLARSKSEMRAIAECVMLLVKTRHDWKSKGNLRKKLKTPKEAEQIVEPILEQIPIDEDITYECPYHQYGGMFGNSYDVYAECKDCKLEKQCRDIYKGNFNKTDEYKAAMYNYFKPKKGLD